MALPCRDYTACHPCSCQRHFNGEVRSSVAAADFPSSRLVADTDMLFIVFSNWAFNFLVVLVTPIMFENIGYQVCHDSIPDISN